MMGHENQSLGEMESLLLDDDNIAVDQSLTPKNQSSSASQPSIFHLSESNGHDHSIASSSSSSSSYYYSGEYLRISVSDPANVEDTCNSVIGSKNTYTTYLITTLTNLVDFDGDEFSVRRRFRDVVALDDRLRDAFRGFIVPLRPDKSVVERRMVERNEFLEQRRVGLERYLGKLAKHPVIRRSEELRVFLSGRGRLNMGRKVDVGSRMLDGAVKLPKQLFWERRGGGVDLNEVSQPAKGGRDLLRIFKEMRQSVSNDWGGVKPLLVEEDKAFLETKDKLQAFEQQLSNVSQQAESLVKAQQDIGDTMGQLGMAFVKLTKFESEGAVFETQRARAADMKIVATASVKASRLYRELNAQTVKHLDKLHEYLGMMLAINNAFSDRSSALLTVQTLLADMSSLNLRIEKLEASASKIFGGDRSRIQKIEELREAVKVRVDAKDTAVKEYERIKENNKNELHRLEREKQDDFMSMLTGFVLNQAGYAEKMANVWEEVAQETNAYVSLKQ